MWRRWAELGALAAAALIAAVLTGGASDPPSVVPPPPSPPHARSEAIADQLVMLAFDADPGAGTPARQGLARWTQPIRLFVRADPATGRLAEASARRLETLTKLPITLVGGGSPNAFLAADDDPVTLFAGPLRRLLTLALIDDARVEGFLRTVVATQPCWVLPVWADRGRSEIKAAVIGIDTKQKRPGVERCVEREMAASLGLLGAGGYLPRSVFTPGSPATRLSFEDQVMLRVLYAPQLAPGLSRAETWAAAMATLPAIRAGFNGPRTPPATPPEAPRPLPPS